MLKRLGLAFAGLFAFVGVASAAGTIAFSLSQQFDEHGKPLGGCKFYTIQAGTVATPQNAYQDAGLTIPLPNPMTCDAAGRLPQFFLADGSIKVRLTDKNGVQQIVADNVLVIGPSSGGGGGGGGVDPTTVAATGDIKTAYGTGSISGWARLNGRTIGSATSGATERANADCQALFVYLWGADANLTVSGGRGVSAAADWAANKTITLPDARGRVLASLDDMGASAAGRLTSSYFGASGTTLGAAGGGESSTLQTTNLPPYTPSGTITNGAISLSGLGGGSNTQFYGRFSTSGAVGIDGGGFFHGLANDLITPQFSQAASTFTGTAQGGASTPLRTVQPTLLVTSYIKL